jgi:uncharacterized ferritin-like protein (DUF455 family)
MVERDICYELLSAYTETDASLKAQITRHIAESLKSGTFYSVKQLAVPLRPGRPAQPELRPPKDMPRRRINSAPAGRIALIHAIAHIELNAIDLALDMILRFSDRQLPFDYVRDWMGVADDEARHFLMLNDRLQELDSFYGALPAHDGLWQAAEETAHDLLARLAITPLVLEARGLDITPQLIDKMNTIGDTKTADCFAIIMEDEIGHVRVGKNWFDYECGRLRQDPISSWQKAVNTYFHGSLKPPFNIKARDAARFSAAFYQPLATPKK